MVSVGDKVVAFILDGSITRTSLEQVAVTNKPITGGKIIIFPGIDGKDVGVRPFSTYNKDDGLVVDQPETLFLPGEPPSYFEPQSKWWDNGVLFGGSETNMYQIGENRWQCIGGKYEMNEYITLRRATEGVIVKSTSAALRTCIMDQTGFLWYDTYGSFSYRLPVRPTVDGQQWFGKAGDILWVWFCIVVPDRIVESITPPTPRTIQTLIKSKTVGRY